MNGENKTFEDLANGQYLGILRMDVDNLGAMFIKGIPEKHKCFASYSTMSFLLDFFFSGHLNSIRERDKYVNDINILYSGGDDIFAIGRWDKAIEFAEDIRKAFARFVGRTDITISAGLTFVKPSFPISKAAKMAGEAEDAAKEIRIGNKNAINMFGCSISWDKEFDSVKEWKEKMVDLIVNYQMPRSILHRIMSLAQSMRAGDVSYIWHTSYSLTRFCEGKSDMIIKFCKKIKDLSCERRKFEQAAVAARWAEFETRFN